MVRGVIARFVQAGVLGIFLLIPSVCRTADTAAVAAALPDEASECRYLLTLCEETRTVARIEEQRAEEAKRKMKAIGPAERARDATWEKEQAAQEESFRQYEGAIETNDVKETEKANQNATTNWASAVGAAKKAETAHNAAHLVYRVKLTDTIEAAQVIRAKHAKMPECFLKCSDVLNAEKFK